MSVSALKPQPDTSFTCKNCGETGALDSHGRLLHLKPASREYTAKCFRTPNFQEIFPSQTRPCGNRCGTSVKWKKAPIKDGAVATYKAVLMEADGKNEDHYCKPMR